MVAAGRDAEEIDDRYPVLERLAKPPVVGRVRVLAHEGVVDRLVALENLPMHLALVVVPDLAARLREDGLDRQQEPHLLRLEDAALRIDERDALAVEHEARLQLGRGQVIVDLAQPSHMLESRRCASECRGVSVSSAPPSSPETMLVVPAQRSGSGLANVRRHMIG